jgi:hypothetical protein
MVQRRVFKVIKSKETSQIAMVTGFESREILQLPELRSSCHSYPY